MRPARGTRLPLRRGRVEHLVPVNDVENQAIPNLSGPRATLSLLALSLKNIGPFDSAEIELLPDAEDGAGVPVMRALRAAG
jgi:hypothetical protein